MDLEHFYRMYGDLYGFNKERKRTGLWPVERGRYPDYLE